MPVDVAVEVLGAKELRKAIRQAGDDGLKKALREANKSAAQKVVDRALPNVPVLSGRLKAAVRALGSQTAGRALAGSARVPYAPAVHWGCGPRPGLRGPHSIPRRPFLFDAAQELTDQIASEYEQEIDKILDIIRKA